MLRFGTDRPDLRIPLELVEVSDLMAEVEFKVFAGPAADRDGRVAALKVPERCPPQSQADRRLHGVR